MRGSGRNTGFPNVDNLSSGKNNTQVDIQGLKAWVKANFPGNSLFRSLLVIEEKLLTVENSD